MILLVDIGNSRIKTACWQNGSLTDLRACDTIQSLDSIWPDLGLLKRVIACTVAAPTMAQRLADWCAEKDATLEWITSLHPIEGLAHSYAQPTSLGDDRWLAMAGARRTYTGPLCVVDCGTATTVDIIDAHGVHQGGAILPGIATMRTALHQHTYDLPQAEAIVEAFATNTKNAIAGGTVYALCGAIERLLHEASKRFDPDLHCIITGGEATLVVPLLQHQCTVDQALVFRGLAAGAGL